MSLIVFFCLQAGLSKIEIKRFIRKREESLQQRKTTTNTKATVDTSNDSRHFLRVGSVTFNRFEPAEKNPWEKKKLGWIPNATTKRARFMNNILALFYKSIYPFCKNAREFV